MIQSLYYLFLIIIPCLSFISSDEPEPFLKFKEWYISNKDSLVFRTEDNGLSYQVRYNPVELKLMNAIQREELKGKKSIQSWYKQNDTYDEFSFKIECPEGDIFVNYSEDKEEYNQKLFYLIESARFDFMLVRKLDTISPVHYQFENTFGNAPFVTMYLAFEKAEKENPIREFLYNDQVFGEKVIPLDISRLNNLNIPKIK